MKLLFAPDSFKGTLTAKEVCRILAEQAEEHIPDAECVSLPVADGGEGLVFALYSACGGTVVQCAAKGPLGDAVSAEYAILPDGTAVIEMSAAAGITLVPKSRRDPMRANTFGVGQLVADAVERGCKKIILGLGGSATNDGGMGLGCALGIRYLDRFGKELEPCGANAGETVSVDASHIPERILDTEFTLACDVDNPLCGDNGASAVYGPQKGATAEQVKLLDKNLASLCRVVERASGKELYAVPGMGAAGGMALPLCAFFNASVSRGLDIVLNALGFDALCAKSDVVITGEGCTDLQSSMGKVPCGVATRARLAGKPVILLSGCLADGCEKLYNKGVTAMFSCCSGTKSMDWQLEHAAEALAFASGQIFKLIASFSSPR